MRKNMQSSHLKLRYIQSTIPGLNIRRLLKKSILFILCFAAIGCTTPPKTNYITTLNVEDSKPKILLMPLDVELSLLTTGGVNEPRADWTESAVGFIQNALQRQSNIHDFELVDYNPDHEANSETLKQVQKLHEVVGATMLEQRVIPLPSKAKDFSWSLGSDAASLGNAYGTHYALYLFMRDSYASAGRQALVAASTVVSALLGTPAATGGVQVGYATLVDLKTGDIVWFNSLARGSGDLREKTAAEASIKFLLDGFPSNR